MMSNTKTRHYLSFAILAIFLTGAVFTGCGKKDGNPENKPEAAEDKPEKTEEAAAKEPRKGKRAEGVRSSAENPFAGTGNARLIELWRKATEENDADAQIDLGVCYQYGDGVERDGVIVCKRQSLVDHRTQSLRMVRPTVVVLLEDHMRVLRNGYGTHVCTGFYM